ncbi:unnamed protein product [Caretta caretta]
MPGAVPPGNTIPELELMLDQYALINSPNKVGLDLAAAWLLWQAGWQWQAAKSQLAIEIDSLKDQCNELEKERDMWKAQTLTASAQASSLSVAAVQAATAEEERQRVETENATLSQAVTCLKDLVLEGSAWENRVRGAYSAWVAAIGVKAQGDAGPYDDWDRDIWFDLDPLDPDPRWPNPRHHVAAGHILPLHSPHWAWLDLNVAEQLLFQCTGGEEEEFGEPQRLLTPKYMYDI